MRGVALSEIVTQLKAELGDASESNTATDARYKLLLKSRQYDLADGLDWPFLNHKWDLPVPAESRYLTLPTVDIRGTTAEINMEKSFKVDVYWNTYYHCISHGFGAPEFNWVNSDLDLMRDPIEKWRMATNQDDPAGDNQIEVWPRPITAQTIRFDGQRKVYDFDADDDVCDIDHLLLVYAVAAEQLALRNQANAPLMLRRFTERLVRLRGGMPGSDPIVLGKKRACCEGKELRPIAVAGSVRVSSYAGTVDLVQDATDGVVAFPAPLSFTPAVVTMSIAKPADGYNLFATLVAGTLSVNGFAFIVDAAPPDGEYDLHYIVSQ